MLRLAQEVVKEEVVKEDEEEILEEVEYALTEEDLARLKEPIEGFIDGSLKLMSQYIYYGPKKEQDTWNIYIYGIYNNCKTY